MSNGPAAATILTFVGVAAVLVLTPGVGTTFLISTVIERGRGTGYLTALGMVAGAAVHATIAVVGTAVLLRRFPTALIWIGIGGGAFIILLGARAVLRALGRRSSATVVGSTDRAPHSPVVTGALIALGNAPVPLFYFVVVPEYVPRGMSRTAGTLLLSLIHLVMAGAWMVTLVSLLGRVAEVLRRPRVNLVLQVTTGLVLIFLGEQAIQTALRP